VDRKKHEHELRLKRQAQLEERRKAAIDKIQKEDRIRENNWYKIFKQELHNSDIKHTNRSFDDKAGMNSETPSPDKR